MAMPNVRAGSKKFCCRNPNLTLRAPAPLSRARVHATDPDMINIYLDLLEETLECHDLLDKPEQVYNMDEMGMPLDPQSVKCVYQESTRR